MMPKQRVDYEARFYLALRRIAAYDPPERLARHCEKSYGLDYHEALEGAYENLRFEALAALKGYRRKKRSDAARTVAAVDPGAGDSTT